MDNNVFFTIQILKLLKAQDIINRVKIYALSHALWHIKKGLSCRVTTLGQKPKDFDNGEIALNNFSHKGGYNRSVHVIR